jgi:hypothetical protein
MGGIFRKLVRRTALPALVLALLGLSAALVQSQELRRFDLRVEGGKLVGSERTIRVTEGDRVELRWTSDQKLEIHMHGYHLEAPVTPGEAAVMDFTAANTGRFPFEAHMGDKHRTILYLEVHPR